MFSMGEVGRGAENHEQGAAGDVALHCSKISSYVRRMRHITLHASKHKYEHCGGLLKTLYRAAQGMILVISKALKGLAGILLCVRGSFHSHVQVAHPRYQAKSRHSLPYKTDKNPTKPLCWACWLMIARCVATHP